MIYEIMPLRRWEEKNERFPEGSVRFYIGNLFVGRAIPHRIGSAYFRFENQISDIINTSMKYEMTLDEIEDDILCSLKEFLNRIIKPNATNTKA